MLYARRKRQEALAEAEAAGDSSWTTDFNKQARMKLLHAFRDACPESLQETYAESARGLIIRDEGLAYLTDEDASCKVDLLNFVLTCHDFLMPTRSRP